MKAKRSIIIAKVGSVFKTRALAAKSSKVGEQGETEGIINHLLERNDIQLIYFGMWYGDVPKNLILIEPFIEGLDENSAGKYQKECWAYDTSRVIDYEPIAFINIAGYAATNATIDNLVGAGLQAAGIRYVGPALNIMQSCKLPRIVINNDPRSYPRESEMVWGWEYVMPAALLSQRTLDWTRMMRLKKIAVREVYAGAENWCEHIRLPSTNEIPCTIVAHAHIKDGCRFKARDNAFSKILTPWEDVENLHNLGLRIYGKGWEHFSRYDERLMPGVIRPNEVMEVLAKSMMCPAVAAGNGFYTGKLRTCLAQRCLPLFYGRGEPHTFDPLEKYLPLNSPLRINKPGDLLRVVNLVCNKDTRREEVIDEIWEASTPNWSLLDDCIDDLLKGRDIKSEGWWQRYGGYRYDS